MKTQAPQRSARQSPHACSSRVILSHDHKSVMCTLRRTFCLLFLSSAPCGAFLTFPTNNVRLPRHRYSIDAELRGTTTPGKLYSTSSSVSSSVATSSGSISDASAWHRERRRQMMEKYGDQIAPLERDHSQAIGLPLLVGVNVVLLLLSLVSGSLPVLGVVLLAIFPGSVCSLWQLQLLHDVVHGCFFDKKTTANRKEASDRLLFWGSMPSIFGYYLYLKYGHLSHHKNLGDPQKATLEQLFDSNQADFEDGDVLFVAHRMKLKGDIGPKIPLPGGKEVKISISNTGFQQWKEGNVNWNAAAFAASFLFERVAIASNDILVAIMGRNLYFPNKPDSFHKDCATYARCALCVRGALWAAVGWKALLFLYLSETLWSIPPHPACAMFLTNHGSDTDSEGRCIPSSSTYAGKWYELLTLNTVFHVEHHDFPTIPFQKLGELRKIAPEFYPGSLENNDDIFSIMNDVFEAPDFYACMDAGLMQKER